MDERLNDVEIHLMHMEETVRELNEVVIHQQQQIDRLEGELALIRAQMEEVAEPHRKAPEEEEPPPHY
jgi:SlyX protein